MGRLRLYCALEGYFFMWNTRSCVATEVVRGNHSVSISFLDRDGEEFNLRANLFVVRFNEVGFEAILF